MLAHALNRESIRELNEVELFARIQSELITRYEVDDRLASEMAWDLLEVLTAVDGDVEMLEKYFLH